MLGRQQVFWTLILKNQSKYLMSGCVCRWAGMSFGMFRFLFHHFCSLWEKPPHCPHAFHSKFLHFTQHFIGTNSVQRLPDFILPRVTNSLLRSSTKSSSVQSSWCIETGNYQILWFVDVVLHIHFSCMRFSHFSHVNNLNTIISEQYLCLSEVIQTWTLYPWINLSALFHCHGFFFFCQHEHMWVGTSIKMWIMWVNLTKGL